MQKIVVIGSGLSAISAIKILVEKGLKPIVLDYGQSLEKENETKKNKCASVEPNQWEAQDIEKLITNPTINNKFPKKMYMGSDFFYLKKNDFINLKMSKDELKESLPAASLAKNGLSTSWGSSVLPLYKGNNKKFPFKIELLDKYYKKILSDINYVAEKDSLIKKFEIYKNPDHAHKNNRDIIQILNKLEKNKLFNNSFVSGHSRLLVNFSEKKGCKNCGNCLSGCVYNFIYKPEQYLNTLIKSNKIEYVPGVFVNFYTKERNGNIKVNFIDKNKKTNSIICEKLIVAAGALNSTILHIKSFNLYEQKFKLLNKNGLVFPILSFQLNKDIWPNRHTMPLFFLCQIKDDKVGMFAQISKANELIIKKLHGKWNKHSILSKIFSNYFLIAHSNLDSENSDSYEIKVNSEMSKKNTLVEIDKIYNKNKTKIELDYLKKFKKIFNSTNLYPIFYIKKETDSQHNGGSLPMVEQIKNVYEVDEKGNSVYSKNIFYVDSAVLPELPATPIALPMMANAMRIVDKINFS